MGKSNSLSIGGTRFLYSIIFMCYLFAHIDMGILAQASEIIQSDLAITEGQMGLLETAMYIGIVLGSVICSILFSVCSPKLIILGAVIFNAGAVAVFSLTQIYWAIFASRIAVGLFLSVFIIYFPVWIDQCAPIKSQAIWISFYFLTEDLGMVLGYGIAVLCNSVLNVNWKWGFMVQSALMVFPVFPLFLVVPGKYFNQTPGGERHKNLSIIGAESEDNASLPETP